MLKCDEVVDFANKPQANKAVSKKFGDVKKISLFERSEFEIFSRRAFCVLLGRAPARSSGVFRGGLEGMPRRHRQGRSNKPLRAQMGISPLRKEI